VESCPVGALSLSNGRVQWDMCRCIGCETCIDVCPEFSTPRARRLTSRQLWQEIEPYADYLDGVTVSGGEPLLQPHFVLEWFRLVKMSSSLTTLVETNGCIAVSVLEQLVPVLDYAMVDLKVMDPDLHRRLTGRGNEMTLKAIRFLAARGILQAVRVCVVPDYSDSLENAIETARFLTQLDPHIPLRFLRFRAHGTRGVAETWRSPPDELMNQMVEAARAEGLLDVSRSM
jgi:YjjW family glycine radical enzyme activase